MKYIILIALLLPGTVMAHEWKQDYWLQRLLTNHVKVVDCWAAVNDEDMITFRQKCSLWSMGSTENKAMVQYWEARAVHPDLNRLEFIALHFPDRTDEDIWAISENMVLINKVHGIIIGMHIAEGLTRNDK